MQTSYKIAFFDIDGTITNHEDGTISDKTKSAIKSLKEKGIQVVAATGRPLSMCEEIRELGIDTFITANGGHVKHKEEVIHKVPLNPKVLKEVYEFAAEQNHGLSFYTEGLKVNGVREIRFAQALKETLFLADYPSELDETEEEVYLLCLFAAEDMMEPYNEKFPDLTFRRWHPFVLNVLEEDVSKSQAIINLLDYFGVDKSEAIAFGDGENDIDMLELVGFGVAMGNGSEKLKSVADYVTKKSSEDGIYYALKQLQII
ncbi:Cof-type HAD-IIB family hydrolase [Sutcliffiella rhizosphaerae]|uniref:Phosphatase n=1 Tax=Sutcliffiella rhizosphaerae TaxID=2880967 RepID=A0ABM8YN24_9BACI|nr:Cof-type HAD-IIB family hydrolase [Sutcliffiella rhizosphaerae]CAG9621243.1 Putative phosphatase [Sutcliffiella rhizosphaerae]